MKYAIRKKEGMVPAMKALQEITGLAYTSCMDKRKFNKWDMRSLITVVGHSHYFTAEDLETLKARMVDPDWNKRKAPTPKTKVYRDKQQAQRCKDLRVYLRHKAGLSEAEIKKANQAYLDFLNSRVEEGICPVREWAKDYVAALNSTESVLDSTESVSPKQLTLIPAMEAK